MPLSQFATFEFDQEYPLMWRRDRVPTLTVQADVAPGMLPESMFAKLAPAVDELKPACRRLPYRDRRHGRGKREVAGLGDRRRSR